MVHTKLVDGEQMDAIERSQFDTPMDAPLLLALGRLHENKALRCSHRSVEPYTERVSLIAGEGPLEQSLREQVVQSGVEARVRFLGWRQEIAALLAAADILVCPSRHEPLGNVVIEGWAHNVPVVATDSAGPRALIQHEETGLLVPIDDSKTLAEAINRVLSDALFAENLVTGGFTACEAHLRKPRSFGNTKNSSRR